MEEFLLLHSGPITLLQVCICTNSSLTEVYLLHSSCVTTFAENYGVYWSFAEKTFMKHSMMSEWEKCAQNSFTLSPGGGGG